MTGIDIVERALRRASQRANEEGVELRLVHGDVTGLAEAGVGSGFRLMLDTGTFHGLTDAQREAMGRAVSAVSAPYATLILACFAPRRRGRCRVVPARKRSRQPSRAGRSPMSRLPTVNQTRWRGCSSSTSASTGLRRNQNTS